MGGIQKAINWYHANQFRIFPVVDKTPIVEFSMLYERRPTVEELRDWFSRDGVGIGICCGYSGVICVDCDTSEDAKWWYKNRPRTEMMTRTNSGGHFYYKTNGADVRSRAKMLIDGQKRGIDLRGYGGFSMAPPSPHPSGGVYQRVGSWDLDKVPTFDPSWVDTPVVPTPPTFGTQDGAKAAAVKYISHIKAVSGRSGHAETYRAAACLIERGMNATEAFNALLAWNDTNAEPKWTERELQHKVDSAWGNVHG